LPSDGREHFTNRSAGYGVAQVWRELSQRFEHEAALGQARVRDLKFGCRDDRMVIKQDIDVDCPRAFWQNSFAPELRFYGVNLCEQFGRREAGFRFHDQVEEPGLLAQILRLGLIDGRLPQQVDSAGFEMLQRVAKIRLAIAEVGSQR